MKKYLLIALAMLSLVWLLLISLRAAMLEAPDKPAGYAMGVAIGALLIPLFFAGVLTGLKKAFSRWPFDWNLFWGLIIVFSFVSTFEKYLEIRNKPQTTQTAPANQ